MDKSIERIQEENQAFQRLLKIMDELREQCPWDKKQTLESLRHLTIEETYELSDAILQHDFQSIKNELGDLLLHIVFYALIAKEQNQFSILEVMNDLCDKLIRRHPHIYGTTKVQDDEEVKRNWELIKQQQEKKKVLSGVPSALPALIRALRIQEKARGVGFDFQEPEHAWDKVMEELREFKASLDTDHAEEELGDLLFAITNFARLRNLNPDTALQKANQKFINRFNFVEEKVIASQKKWQDFSLDELDLFWNQAKQNNL